MICTIPDEYVNNRSLWETHWHVTLNDGTEVWDDDYRPEYTINGMRDPSWSRLKRYCDENKLWVTNMYLRFRSHYEHLEPNQDGYFFIRKMLAQMGGYSSQFFITGVLKGGELHSTEWRVPELIPVEHKIRNFEKDEQFLIKRL